MRVSSTFPGGNRPISPDIRSPPPSTEQNAAAGYRCTRPVALPAANVAASSCVT